MVSSKKTIAALSMFALIMAMTACNSASSKEVYGKITEISDTKITIETGTYEEPAQPKDVEKPSDPKASDSSAKGGAPPAKSEGDNGDASGSASPGEGPPDGGDQESAPPQDPGGFTSDGKTAAYTLSSNIDVTDLKEGALVKLSLEDDTVTAIETVGPPDGESPGTDSETGTAESTGSFTVSGKKSVSEAKDYDATESNVSTVLVADKGTLTLKGGTLTKSGNTTSDEDSSFYGLNAILAVTGGSSADLDGTTLTSSSQGSNAIFATGKGSKITAKNFSIFTTGDSARGLDATYGGAITASSGDIVTKGAHCAPIATDRGSGTITVDNTTISSEGAGSPCIYSTGKITATAVTGIAAGSQIAVVEGKNQITLKRCILQGAGKNGIMLYQSTSGDAAEGEAVLKATDSTLTTTSEGPMFYVTNTAASITLKNTSLYYSSDILVNAAGNSTNNWGTPGENGGELKLTGKNQTLNGNIQADKLSTVSVVLTEKSSLKGSVNGKNTAKSASLSIDKSSSWELTGNSYLSAITNKDVDCSNIASNGFSIYYDKENDANKWLSEKTIDLPGGGKLTPAG